MMFKNTYKRLNKVWIFIIVFSVILFLFTKIGVCDSEKKTRYIIVYEDLYKYGESYSDVLELYVQLKSDLKNVLLVQTDRFKQAEIKEEDIIVIVESSFSTEKKYNDIMKYYKNKGNRIYDDRKIDNRLKTSGVFIAIDRIYPFSDLNKLMEVTDYLNEKGINFICTIMPVYQNHEIEAFDKFVKVLKYINQNGGKFFIHYPVFNDQGTYNTDPKNGFKRAIEEYRNRGIKISGISISEDRLFTNSDTFQGLNLPFLLVTKQETKLNNQIDLLEISQKIDKHIFIKGYNLDQFDVFSYIAKEYYGEQQVVCVDINNNIESLDNFINILYSEHISIKDFEEKKFKNKLKKYDFGEKLSKIDGKEKNQLEEFRKKEMEKIRGENLEKEEENAKGYDISIIIKAGIKVAFIIILILIAQVFIGRRHDKRKFFKK